MPKAIISDTSCSIILSKIGEFDLLHKVYGEIITTQEVADEFGEPFPEWISVRDLKNKTNQHLIELYIDKGESSAIALALEFPGSTVILDDYKARKVAFQLGLNCTGTIGVIIKSKLMGINSSIKPILEKMKQTNFYLSRELELMALKEAKENF